MTETVGDIVVRVDRSLSERLHYATTRTYGSGSEAYTKVTALCYHRHTDPSILTDDPFKVTCGKCQQHRVFKVAARQAFA